MIVDVTSIDEFWEQYLTERDFFFYALYDYSASTPLVAHAVKQLVTKNVEPAS